MHITKSFIFRLKGFIDLIVLQTSNRVWKRIFPDNEMVMQKHSVNFIEIIYFLV